MKILVFTLIVLSLSTCMSIPPPILQPFSDNHDWMLYQDLTYVIGDSEFSITVPKGFVTDFASIPQALWSFGLSPHGLYSKRQSFMITFIGRKVVLKNKLIIFYY